MFLPTEVKRKQASVRSCAICWLFLVMMLSYFLISLVNIKTQIASKLIGIGGIIRLLENLVNRYSVPNVG